MAQRFNWNQAQAATGSFTPGRAPTRNGRSPGVLGPRSHRSWINGNIGRWFMTAPTSPSSATETRGPTEGSPLKPFPLRSADILDSRMQFTLALNLERLLTALGTAC